MTNPSHFVELVALIRMALQKEKSEILRLVLKQYYFMPNKCFLNISPLSFGLLHSNALKIEWAILIIVQMGGLLIKHLLVWIPSSLMFQTSTRLVVLAMSWITVYNLASQWFQNGSQEQKWACTLDVHPHMLQTLLWFSIHIQVQVFPQFFVVFDDDFTTVPYLRSSQVPPFWADLVCTSTKLHIYTKRQVDTQQSLPELTPEIGDIMSEQKEIPNI